MQLLFYALIEKKDSYDIFDYKGNLLKSFKKNNSSVKPTASSVSNYISIYYDNKSYIFDLSNDKELIVLNDNYYVSEVNNNILLLKNKSSDEILVINGMRKILELDNCYQASFVGNKLKCFSGDDAYKYYDLKC